MIRVAFGSVPKDGGTFTFYRNMRPILYKQGIDLRCVSVGAEQARLSEASFVNDGCVLLSESTCDLKAQAKAFADWCDDEKIDIVFGVNSPAILSSLPHLPERIRVLSRCANGFSEGYRLTLMGRERLVKVVALVPRLRDDLITNYGVSPDCVVLIPNGASPERFIGAASAVRGNGVRLELGFLGRLEHTQKGVLHLPAILERLDGVGVPYRLRIAGKGKHETQLAEAFAAHMADGRVQFMGTLTPAEIPGFLSEIDVFLFTSHFEGCPNALLEAMMAGSVPVSWKLPGITDFLIQDGETGFLSEVGDIEAFAEAVVGLHEDRDRLNDVSRAVSSVARERFSTGACGRSYVKLLNEVMVATPPPWQPVPWPRFQSDPLFRPHPLGRIFPARHRDMLRVLAGRLRGETQKKASVRKHLITSASPRQSVRIHQIINSIDPKRGGAERLARQLHEALRAAGFDARLIALEACDVSGLEGAISLGLKSPYDFRALLRLDHYARGIAPTDIVHVHLFPTSAHVAALAHSGRLKGQLLFTEHNTNNRRRDHMLGGLIDRGVYSAYDKIISISKGVEEALLESSRFLAGRTVVIENGCRLEFQEPMNREEKSTPVRIVSVGRLVPAKNYSTALKVVAQLMPIDLRYTIAGEGAERVALERLSRDLGIDGRVEFAGYVRDVPALLRDADIFLMPSTWEGFGIAAVEAMNASLPVVAADVPGLREVVGCHGSCAFLVDPADPSAIAEALRCLLVDADLRASMGLKAFERAQKFDIVRFVDAHLHLYESLRRRTPNAA